MLPIKQFRNNVKLKLIFSLQRLKRIIIIKIIHTSQQINNNNVKAVNNIFMRNILSHFSLRDSQSE